VLRQTQRKVKYSRLRSTADGQRLLRDLLALLRVVDSSRIIPIDQGFFLAHLGDKVQVALHRGVAAFVRARLEEAAGSAGWRSSVEVARQCQLL
jgi:hypothetical protein